MALKDIWIDLVDGVSDINADDINSIAGAVIDIENEGGGSTDLSNYYTKTEVDDSINSVRDIAIQAYDYADQAASQIVDKEDKSNKTLSISADSTDSQYPSAKAVYDLVDDMVGDIETLLGGI